MHQPGKISGLIRQSCIKLAVVLPLSLACLQPAQSAEPPFTIQSPQILLLDAETGSILFSRQADTGFAPASLAKLMSAEIVFSALRSGAITPQTSFTVSEDAWRRGGAPSGTATMFAKIKSQISVQDLLQGLVVQAANDAALILAEGISGNEAQFTRSMNERAQQLGLKSSVFVNATGLPAIAGAQIVTLSDMTRLAQHLQTNYPDYYPLYSQESFSWNAIMQRNRNPLLKLDLGADGLALGGTKDSGFSIIASAQKNGRRIFVGLNGAASAQQRGDEAAKLLRWALDDFVKVPVFTAGTAIAQAALYGGVQGSVGLVLDQDAAILLPVADQGKIRAQVLYQAPVAAPIRKGQRIGSLQIHHDKALLLERPLFAAENVAEGSLRAKAADALYELATGWLRRLW